MSEEIKELNKASKKLYKKSSFADLYAMYLFIKADLGSHGFGLASKQSRDMVSQKLREIEDQMNTMIYGENPYKITITGQKPETIDLDKFTVIKDKKAVTVEQDQPGELKTYEVAKTILPPKLEVNPEDKPTETFKVFKTEKAVKEVVKEEGKI